MGAKVYHAAGSEQPVGQIDMQRSDADPAITSNRGVRLVANNSGTNRTVSIDTSGSLSVPATVVGGAGLAQDGSAALKLTSTAGPAMYMRMGTAAGDRLQFINSAYTAVIATMQDNGTFSAGDIFSNGVKLGPGMTILTSVESGQAVLAETSRNNTTYTDTNLTVSFIAPTSGRVMVTYSGYEPGATASGTPFQFSFRMEQQEGPGASATAIANTYTAARGITGSYIDQGAWQYAGNTGAKQRTVPLGGLTPGSTYVLRMVVVCPSSGYAAGGSAILGPQMVVVG